MYRAIGIFLLITVLIFPFGEAILTDPECCERIPIIENSDLVATSRQHYTKQYREGSGLTFTCHPGYVQQGSNEILCGKRGMWQINGHCEAIRCGLPPLLANGVVSTKIKFASIGTILSFECSRGFSLRGTDTVECTQDGQWKVNGNCEDARCPEPPVVDNGALRTGDRKVLPIGSTVEFSCNSGYFARGPASMECIPGGQWKLKGRCEEALKCGDVPSDVKAGRLQHAAETGDLGTIKDLIISFPRDKLISEAFWQQNNYGITPLVAAAREGQFDALKFMWPCLEPVRRLEDENHLTPIHAAAMRNFWDMVEFLLRQDRAFLELRDSTYGRTPLHVAAKWGRMDVVRGLVGTFRANVSAKSNANDNEQTPMHLASRDGQRDVVKHLAEAKPCLVNEVDSNNKSPLEVAKEAGATRVVELLSPNLENMTRLLKASERGNTEDVKTIVNSTPRYQLINHAFWVNGPSSEKGDTPLHRAAMTDKMEPFHTLYTSMPECIDSVNANHLTPIQVAAKHNSISVVDYLASRNRPLLESVTKDAGFTPLHVAVQHGHFRMVQRLVIQHRMSVYVKSHPINYECLPIHQAAWYGQPEVTKFLLAGHPDLANVKDSRGWTPAKYVEMSPYVRPDIRSEMMAILQCECVYETVVEYRYQYPAQFPGSRVIPKL